MEKPDEKGVESVRDFERMRPERSMPLHNFTLPKLKWGNQRFLRCTKLDSSSSDEHRLRRQVSLNTTCGRQDQNVQVTNYRNRRGDRAEMRRLSDGDEVTDRTKADLREIVYEIKKSSLRLEEPSENNHEDEQKEKEKPKRREKKEEKVKQKATETQSRNLRTRKGSAAENSAGTNRSSPPLLRKNDHKKPSRPKFSLTLTKKEIEEDFLGMTGELPPRRPKKRTGTMQRQLDSLFPGSWLAQVTQDSYKIPESSERRKRY